MGSGVGAVHPRKEHKAKHGEISPSAQELCSGMLQSIRVHQSAHNVTTALCWSLIQKGSLAVHKVTRVVTMVMVTTVTGVDSPELEFYLSNYDHTLQPLLPPHSSGIPAPLHSFRGTDPLLAPIPGQFHLSRCLETILAKPRTRMPVV